MKKHLFLIVFILIMLVVGGGLFFLLMLNRSQYVEVKSKLEESEERYSSLSGAKPYPSPPNVSVINSNLMEGEQFFADLQEKLCVGEVTPVEIERAQFAGLLETTVDSLTLSATNQNVMLPSGFFFGFDAYRAGKPPTQKQVPRLVQQLEVVRNCSQLLFDHGIFFLERVEREVFEEEMGMMGMMPGMSGMGYPGGRGVRSSRSSRRSTRTTESGEKKTKTTETTTSRKKGAFSTEGLTLTFTARDENLWKILDAITQNPRFTIITSITMQNAGSRDEGLGGFNINRPAMTGPAAGMGMMAPPGGIPGMGGGYGMMPPGMGGGANAPHRTCPDDRTNHRGWENSTLQDSPEGPNCLRTG